MSLKTKAAVSILTMALVVTVYSFFSFTGAQAAAHVTLQVNPAVQFTIANNNKVIEVQALNDDAKSLVEGLKLIGTEVTEVLELLTDKAIQLGFVKSNEEFVVTFRAAEKNISEEFLNQLAEKTKQAISVSLVAANQANEVKTVVISKELFEFALKEGALPSVYIDLLEANVSQETIQEILLLANMEGVNKVKFLEELNTIGSAMEDMLEAGFDEKQALTLLQGAILADKEIEELSTIVAAMIDIKDAGGNPEQSLAFIKAALEQGIDQETLLEEVTTLTAAYIDSALIDLVEDGLTEAEAMAKVQAAIAADPSLEKLDDLLEGEATEDDEEDSEDDEDESEDDEDDESDESTEGRGN
ncbi:MAG: hypothetical protein FD169_2374 [Bacillota bacterium]|nr:MAG: hypothetical protein FD169_2374 [Bacillota bacterium]